MDDPTRNRYLGTQEAARYCGLSHRTLEKLRISGGGPPFLKVTLRRVIYRVSDLDRWLCRDLRASTSDPGSGAELVSDEPKVSA